MNRFKLKQINRAKHKKSKIKICLTRSTQDKWTLPKLKDKKISLIKMKDKMLRI